MQEMDYMNSNIAHTSGPRCLTEEGTKRQKSSLLRYWTINCAKFCIDIHTSGPYPQGIRKKCFIFAGFSSAVVTYLRRSCQSLNIKMHAERVVRAVRGYSEHMNRLSSATRRCIDFKRTLRRVTRLLLKIYPTMPIAMVPLLVD